MLAAVYHGPGDLRVEEYPRPQILSDEILLRVDNASICATDLRICKGSHRKYPDGTIRVPGHELVGTIAEVGGSVTGFSAGDEVFVAPNMGCGHCRQCLRGQNNLCPNYQAFGITLDGAFAEYMRITAPAIEQGNIVRLSPGVNKAAAALAEPFACVLHGQDLVHCGEGDIVLIQGAGPIGLMHVLLARMRGASLIVAADRAPERLKKARELGADHVVNVVSDDLEKRVADITRGEGPSVIIVAAPVHAAQEQAIRIAGMGGRINFFAGLPKERCFIELDANLVHYKELVVTGSTACSTKDCRRAAELVASGKIDLSSLISQRFTLASANDAFAAAADPAHLKVVLQPG